MGSTGTGRGHRQRIGDHRQVQEPAARREADQLDEGRAAELRQRQRPLCFETIVSASERIPAQSAA